MKTLATPVASPMPVSSFFCDQFECDAIPVRRANSPLRALSVLGVTLGSLSMWLSQAK